MFTEYAEYIKNSKDIRDSQHFHLQHTLLRQILGLLKSKLVQAHFGTMTISQIVDSFRPWMRTI